MITSNWEKEDSEVLFLIVDIVVISFWYGLETISYEYVEKYINQCLYIMR